MKVKADPISASEYRHMFVCNLLLLPIVAYVTSIVFTLLLPRGIRDSTRDVMRKLNEFERDYKCYVRETNVFPKEIDAIAEFRHPGEPNYYEEGIFGKISMIPVSDGVDVRVDRDLSADHVCRISIVKHVECRCCSQRLQ